MCLFWSDPLRLWPPLFCELHSCSTLEGRDSPHPSRRSQTIIKGPLSISVLSKRSLFSLHWLLAGPLPQLPVLRGSGRLKTHFFLIEILVGGGVNLFCNVSLSTAASMTYISTGSSILKPRVLWYFLTEIS